MVLKMFQRHEVDTTNTIQLDPILEQIGSFGKFQIMQLFLTIVALGIGTSNAFSSYAFTAYMPKYRCLVPQCENITTATYYDKPLTSNDRWGEEDLTFAKFSQEAVMSLAVSQHKCKRVTTDTPAGNCQLFLQQLEDTSISNNVETCSIEELVFDKKIVESSYAIHYGFLCDKFPLRGIFNSLHMGGMLLGSLIILPLADKIGRKPAAIIAIALTWSVGLMNAYSDSLVVFALGRIGSGMGAISAWICLVIITVESTTPSFTNIVQNSPPPFLMFFFMILPALAYFIRDYFTLELALSAPHILGIIPVLCLPESTRWLIAKGRLEEAKVNIFKIAKINGKVRPDQIEISLEPRTKEERNGESIVSMLKNKTIFLRTVNCFFQWFVVTGSYYGLGFGSAEIAGDPYLNFALTNLTELPNFIGSLYFFDRLGRRWSLVLCQCLSGVCCLATGALFVYGNVQELQIITVTVGYFFAGLAFNLAYLYCSEIYPTGFRATMFGACSVMGRIGGIYALGLDGAKQHWKPLPFTLIGAQAVMAGILAFFLPDTTGGKLPDTIEDAVQHVGKNLKYKPWCGFENSENIHHPDVEALPKVGRANIAMSDME